MNTDNCRTAECINEIKQLYDLMEAQMISALLQADTIAINAGKLANRISAEDNNREGLAFPDMTGCRSTLSDVDEQLKHMEACYDKLVNTQE